MQSPTSPKRFNLPGSAPSTGEDLEREISSLRSFRRRSGSVGGASEGGLTTPDLDLPSMSVHGQQLELADGMVSSSLSASSSTSSTLISGNGTDLDVVLGRPRRLRPAGARSSTKSSTASSSSQDDDQDDEDTSHLFWVPANLHPELAPGEFRAFLKEHAHAHAQQPEGGIGLMGEDDSISLHGSLGGKGTGAQPLSRVPSSGLNRKRSMLSRQYQPRANDGVENEPPLPETRLNRRGSSRSNNRLSIYSSPLGDEGDSPSLVDLQMLEELADEAAKSDDPSALRSLLRRSWSVNGGPANSMNAIDGVAEDSLEENAPILPSKPLIRRTARTKIRKAGMEGNAHRFGPSKRSPHDKPSLVISTDPSTLEGEDEAAHYRPESPTESAEDGSTESSDIVGSYSTSSAGHDTDSTAPSSYSNHQQLSEFGVDKDQHPHDSIYAPRRPLSPPQTSETTIRKVRTPSPDSEPEHDEPIQSPTTPTGPSTPQRPPLVSSSSTVSLPAESTKQQIPAIQRSPTAESLSSFNAKEKEKKSGFFSKNKSKKELEKEKEKEKEKAKSKGGFGGLFGKKKHDEPPSPVNAREGAAAAAALLGTAKSAKPGGATSPSRTTSPGPHTANNFSRYPIHVERAVYRLSHIKLANPRRPLYEQVLISNLMFWYLSIINKKPEVKDAEEAAEKDKEKALSSEAEIAAAEKAKAKTGKGTPNRSTAEGSTGSFPIINGHPRHVPFTPRQSSSIPTSNKRASLTKPDPRNGGRAPGRSAENAIRAPQYGIQQSQIDKEYAPQRPGVGPPQQQHMRPPPPNQQHHLRGSPSPPPPGMMVRPNNPGSPPPHPSQNGAQPVSLYGGIPVGSDLPRGPPPPFQARPDSQSREHSQSPPPPRPDSRSGVSGGPPPMYPQQPQQPGGPNQLQREPPQRRPSGDPSTPPPMIARPPGPGGPTNGLPQNYRPPSPNNNPGGGPQPGQVFTHPSSGPIPGQVFRPPPSSGGPRPGEVFNPNAGPPQIGQVFNHPNYRPTPMRPGPPGQPQMQPRPMSLVPGQPMPQQGRPLPQQQGRPPIPMQQRPPPGPGQQPPFDPRYGGVPQQRPPYNPNGPSPPRPNYPMNGPPPNNMMYPGRPAPPQGYATRPPPPIPGQGYPQQQGYPGPLPPQQQHQNRPTR